MFSAIILIIITIIVSILSRISDSRTRLIAIMRAGIFFILSETLLFVKELFLVPSQNTG